tara:strand:+ start:846 stop:1676 length:831 start_codon:yes stop_codon:yes gene_type:complete
MPGVERQGDLATCPLGHNNTGSSTVFANGKGVTRVELDRAGGGLIIGAGSETVFVEGFRVSLPGDVILPHSCCGSPGCGPHCTATTTSESSDVYAGIGFPTVATGGGGATVAPDLVLVSVAVDPVAASANAGGYGLEGDLDYIPHTYVSGTIAVNYTIQNYGATPTGSFAVGLWEIDEILGFGPFVLVPAEVNLIVPTPQLLHEQQISLQPYQISERTFTLENYDPNYWNLPLNSNGEPTGESSMYYYSIYADLYLQVIEPDEKNTYVVQTFTVTT